MVHKVYQVHAAGLLIVSVITHLPHSPPGKPVWGPVTDFSSPTAFLHLQRKYHLQKFDKQTTCTSETKTNSNVPSSSVSDPDSGKMTAALLIPNK